jgi:hypothetical protein
VLEEKQMSIEKDLKKDGIEVISLLDTQTINLIARLVSEKLALTFPEHHLLYENLFIRLSRLHMYRAKMPDGYAEANYLYRNSSIYFKDQKSYSHISNSAIHECLHHLQEVRDEKNNLIRLGLCDFSDLRTYGLALNEAAVQLMASKALGNEVEITKYYEISLPTISPDYYPIICNLVNQMAYVTGEYSLFHSTLYGDDEFKNQFISLCGEKAFYTIEDRLDDILAVEEKIIYLTNQLNDIDCSDSKVQRISKKICHYKEEIKKIFLYTQNLILTSYFDQAFKEISSLDEIEEYRRKLYNYKNIIGITDDYSFFNDYYLQQMMLLEEKYEQLENPMYSLSLIPTHQNIFAKLFGSIKTLFYHRKTQREKEP